MSATTRISRSASVVSLSNGRKNLLLTAGFVAFLGGAVLYAILVPQGLPYDEPSHWLNVVHIARHWSLPQVGAADTSYEAQQAPFAYVVDAILYRIAETVHPSAGFYVVRLSGAVWILLAATITLRLARRCLPRLPSSALTIGVVVTFTSPMLLACSMSVQNDIPALVIGLLAINVATSSDLTLLRATAAGGLAGLAILTKLTAWPVLACLCIRSLWRRRLYEAAVLGSCAVAACGWWLFRNHLVYGDFTGASAVDRIGVSFPPSGFHGFSTLLILGRGAVTSLWLPVEYYRNTISAPDIVSVTTVLVTAVIVIGGSLVLLRTNRHSPFALLLICGVLAVGAFALISTLIEGAGFRIAYACLPAWAMMIAGLSSRAQWIRVVAVGFTLALNIWVLMAVTALNPHVISL